jgi:signal transduction histidine kinase
VAGLALITGGFESTAYWMLPGLIVLNAISIPLATPQIVLNLLLSAFYLGAGILNNNIRDEITLMYNPGRRTTRPAAVAHTNPPPPPPQPAASGTNAEAAPRRKPFRWDDSTVDTGTEISTEPRLLRIFVLLLLTACCYGVQVLAERQRRTMEEEREFAVREAQLRSAGRVAAEIAHQLKNPLAIINNAVFSLQRSLKEGKPTAAGQIQIVQEEIDRADRILTDLMGYAQLNEGRMERLNVVEALDDAITQVFPTAANYNVAIERHYASGYPPLLMQRRHLSGIFVNLLQNAREALNGTGNISVAAACRPDNSIEVAISDNGPGIPADKLEKIFDAHYTSKQKGTGLGLAIVKHNVELYAGTVRAESRLGQGARFILVFPAKTVMNPFG